MKIVCVSDTHGFQVNLPDCDVLVHAGDLTNMGKMNEIAEGLDWLEKQSADEVILVPGNHDFGFQNNHALTAKMCKDRGIHLLIDELFIYRSVSFYGSPWQPFFCDWAFNLYPGALRDKWSRIPDGVNVLITHGPAYGILDETKDHKEIGCPHLKDELVRIKPSYHIFGHSHHQNGCRMISDTPEHPYLAVNASICNEDYRPVNPPQIIWI